MLEMNRDPDIQRVFETADDSLQGVLGYHLYVIAMQKGVDVENLLEHLPDRSIPHTFSWVRYYDKQDLVNTFNPLIFELFQSRISLIAMTNVYEVALENLISCLNKKGHPQYLNEKRLRDSKRLYYKDCIKWAYDEAKKCDIGDTDAIKRLPTTFGLIDNARRLRNLIVHNHGLYNIHYEKDVIDYREITKNLHPHYVQLFKKNPQRLTPVMITTKDIILLSQAHIEAVHLLHNSLQKNYFGFPNAYDYREENKAIEWEKVLLGNAKVRVILQNEGIKLSIY